MAKLKKITTQINTAFFDFQLSRSILLNNTYPSSIALPIEDRDGEIKEVNKACAEIQNKGMSYSALQNEDRYFHIAFADYDSFKRTEQDKLICKVENYNGDYSISTGLYCGVINFGDNLPQLTITTGYSDAFFKRILNFCCGIYADKSTDNDSAESESIYSLLVQYMFLSSLKKVANTSFPKKYVQRKERGYNVRGNVDIEAFINHDLLMFDQKITYTYSERTEIQPIIDVLYTALKSCQINGQNDILPSIQNLKAYIFEHYSGTRPSLHVINNIDKDKSLFNSLYAGFKRPLELAKVIIKHNDLSSGESQKLDRPSGFLVDSSFLWEMYIYNLMTLHLPEWNIEAQSVISFYDSTFFSKKNYPDFVLTNRKTGKIFVLDAKFKRMKYENIDVDNEDVRQLHSYSYYYSLREKEKFGGAALIYPSKIFRPDGVKHMDFLFGEETSNAKFGVFSIKDPSKEESIVSNEEKFIIELKAFLEGK